MPGPPAAHTGDGGGLRRSPRPGCRTARETLAGGYLNTSDLAATVDGAGGCWGCGRTWR
jgi:hypothetical protein